MLIVFLIVRSFESFYCTSFGNQGKICGSVQCICPHKSRMLLETHILLKQNAYKENVDQSNDPKVLEGPEDCLLPYFCH